MTETDSRFYELMVIISGELTEKEFEKELDEVRGMLNDAAQKIDYEESWGRRDMAYKIKRQSRGYYVIFDFHAEPTAIKELSSNMKLHPTVLRHLLTQLPDDYVSAAYKDAMVHRRKVDSEEELAKDRAQAGKKLDAPVKATVQAEETSVESTVASKKPKKSVDELVENPDIVM